MERTLLKTDSPAGNGFLCITKNEWGDTLAKRILRHLGAGLGFNNALHDRGTNRYKRKYADTELHK